MWVVVLGILAGSAVAAEVEVATTVPIQVVVDGQPMTFDQETGVGWMGNLLAGKHTVESRNLFGKTTAYKEVELALNERIRFEYRKKELWHVGTYALPEPAPSEVMAAAGNSVVVASGPEGSGPPVSGPPGHSPRPPPPPPPPAEMEANGFHTLLAQLDEAGFTDEKMSLVRAAAAHNWFTCKQLAGILDRFNFDKVAVVGVLRPRILDPQNSAVIHDRFDFPDDARKAQAYFH